METLARATELKNCRAVRLQHIDDGVDGSLAIADQTSIPFAIARVYYVTRLGAAAVRGKHAHKTLQQVLFCIFGSFQLELDDGTRRTSVVLSRPEEGIYIGADVWHEMRDFSPDCVILVFASALYDESDYLRNYDDFLTHVSYTSTDDR
jgi:dTDP-4-dehydrorhamnose 3,5-epimerase-like enzyme